MIQNFIGIFLLIIPFVLIFSYSSIREGLLKISLYIALFHITLSIISQAFHFFTYPNILILNIVFVISLFSIVFYKKRNFLNFPKMALLFKDSFKNNWLLFLGLGLVFLLLFSVRYSYSGPVNTLRGVEKVSDSTYVYPFVSDEWVTIAEIKYSIANNALPLVNPLDHNIPIPNILFAFPSLLAEIFLLTGLNPLTGYWIVSIYFALILCISIYILLKTYKVNSKIALLSILFVPYITNSGNMLALWSLLPFTIGTILLIWQLVSQKFENNLSAFIFATLAIIIYPPIIVFVFPSLCVYLYFNQKEFFRNFKENILKYFTPVLISIFVFVFIFYLVFYKFGTSISDVLEKYIIRPNLDIGLVSYPIWHIVPILGMFFGILGIYKAIKNKYYQVLVIFLIGILYWCIYAFLNKVIIIEYPRIIFITSIFIVFFAGIGGEWILSLLAKNNNNKKFQKNKNNILNTLIILTFIIFIFIFSSYSSRDSWKHLTLKLVDESGKERVIVPAPPVNRYLTEDDLKLFENIKEENFISPPWKGLVIGVATDNFPFDTKSSTISNGILPYAKFMNFSCEEKAKIAKEYLLSYVYSMPFSCIQFEQIDASSEGLYFYKYNSNV